MQMELLLHYSSDLLPDPCKQNAEYATKGHYGSKDKIEPFDRVRFGAAFFPAFLPFIKLNYI